MFSSRSQVSSRHEPTGSYALLSAGSGEEETIEMSSKHTDFRHEDSDGTEGNFPDRIKRSHLPWWKRPSPWWLIIAVPFSAIAMSATFAPRVEVFTLLACTVHKPELLMGEHPISRYILPPRHQPPLFPQSDLTNQTSSPMGGMGMSTASPCASDPVVQAVVAKLTTAASALSGVLCILTTAFWGAFSDRHGRTRVISLAVFGLLLSDLTFVFVTKNVQHLPGGYWLLLLGPILDGALGGMATATAATQAYLADTTDPSEHSRIFALFMGVAFLGGGIGPMVGGLVVRWTGSPLSVFYLSIAINGFYIFLGLFVIPEPLTKSQMQASSAHYENLRSSAEQNSTFANRIRRLFAFLEPLTIFFPEAVERSPSKGRQWNWNPTLLALAYGSTLSIMGSMTFKFQFVASYFGWTSEHIGYYLSVTGAVQALFLSLLLPSIIKLVKLFSRVPTDSYSKTGPSHPSSFDLSLARISLFVEIIGYTLMPFAPTGLFYTAFTILASFGAGFSPAIQSVALELYAQQNDGTMESGKLFGGLSVIQALAQIVGPSIYGLVFVKTVATFPKAIFFVSVASDCFSFLCVSLVRLSSDVRTDAEELSRLASPSGDDVSTPYSLAD
ncbi:major facilitator superfamily domain-containing protein [Mycena alexandri]|uniref:Major facilitator superfamily domain-containing protein n=1 Tax=Mycena alexandri TaxID=1745969 RepID=A0AAD6T670_9AGAR|nr:major facilitator superfamily domain-containing protein [Mycena alexandri]